MLMSCFWNFSNLYGNDLFMQEADAQRPNGLPVRVHLVFAKSVNIFCEASMSKSPRFSKFLGFRNQYFKDYQKNTTSRIFRK